MKKTAEAVSYLHPDKICDQISDAIVDAHLTADPHARVAVECAGGHGHLTLYGEITSKEHIDCGDVARATYKKLTGKDIVVTKHITQQSPDIAKGVDTGGAGDQGIMVGYATTETPEMLPVELVEARKILQPFRADAKSQVTTNDAFAGISDIVLSVQGKTRAYLEKYLRRKYGTVPYLYCNNTGAFVVGGFDADSGVTGRKIVQDQYGPRVPTGGGAFSGKDATKVDRSGAYMARWLAIQVLKQAQAHDVVVQLAYVIGAREPVMADAQIFYNANQTRFYPIREIMKIDLSVDAIIERFKLRCPIYEELAKNGHFGRKELLWEQ